VEQNSVCLSAAIDRLVRAYKRIQDLSGDLPKEEIVQAYKERTEALLGLIRWDLWDWVANVIRRLVRAQDHIQALHDSSTYRGFASDEEFDAADVEREEAILALMLAPPAEDYPTGTHRFHERAKKLAMLERDQRDKDPEAGSSSAGGTRLKN
jgi:hypothetical protein